MSERRKFFLFFLVFYERKLDMFCTRPVPLQSLPSGCLYVSESWYVGVYDLSPCVDLTVSDFVPAQITQLVPSYCITHRPSLSLLSVPSPRGL